MAKAFIQYLLMLPCFVNMVRIESEAESSSSSGSVIIPLCARTPQPHFCMQLTIYSICNMNDISWGTRDNHTGEAFSIDCFFAFLFAYSNICTPQPS